MTQSGRVGWTGFAPEVRIGAGNPEALKYGRLWECPEYRVVAPGVEWARVFLDIVHPPPGAEVLDLGCGTGRGMQALATLGGLRVTGVDFVKNALDPELRDLVTAPRDGLRFVKADLEQPLPVAAPYGFCTDVMEHIPPNKVPRVLRHILRAAETVFFAIATMPDRCGALIGEPLHLTVQPYVWWLATLERLGATITWTRNVDDRVSLFVASAWITGTALRQVPMVLNTEAAQIRANIQHNIAQGWRTLQPQPSSEDEVVILGGGPSLPSQLDEIRALRAAGAKLVTLNGAYHWALAHDLAPVTQVVVDARPFNARFTKPVRDDCQYLLASQCDPSVFDGLPPARTFLWHVAGDTHRDLYDAQYPEGWFFMPGGSTVLLRIIPVLRMAGFYKFHLFGCDSCLAEDGTQHHAYAQPENDRTQVINVTCGERVFRCHAWMVSQAQEFIDLIRLLGDQFQLAVYGPGLLAHILETGARLDELSSGRS